MISKVAWVPTDQSNSMLRKSQQDVPNTEEDTGRATLNLECGNVMLCMARYTVACYGRPSQFTGRLSRWTCSFLVAFSSLVNRA